MTKSSIKDHKFTKGKFVTPFNTIENLHENSWSHQRLPEYLWIALVIKNYGREKGLEIFHNLLQDLVIFVPNLKTLRISDILELSEEEQKELYKVLLNYIEKETLTPLSIFITLRLSSPFVESFFCKTESFKSRLDSILSVLSLAMNHQSDFATDIRFVVAIFQFYCGRVKVVKGMEGFAEMIFKYPAFSHDDPEMRKIRPTIRCFEITPCSFEENNKINFVEIFWKKVSSMTECNLYLVKFNVEERDISVYIASLHKTFAYLKELFTETEPLSDKMKVIIGIATYAYKRFRETSDYNLYNTISGRSNLRGIIDNYITLKYLLLLEKENPSVWSDYQIYGLGSYKMTLKKYIEADHSNTYFIKEYVEMLINEHKSEEFIDMDRNLFNKESMRNKAQKVEEKELYDFYYDHASSFEHGLWGAIRETSMLTCDNPAHQFHNVPDTELEIVYTSILPDLIMIMNKLILLLDDIYGLPRNEIEEVLSFGK